MISTVDGHMPTGSHTVTLLFEGLVAKQPGAPAIKNGAFPAMHSEIADEKHESVLRICRLFEQASLAISISTNTEKISCTGLIPAWPTSYLNSSHKSWIHTRASKVSVHWCGDRVPYMNDGFMRMSCRVAWSWKSNRL